TREGVNVRSKPTSASSGKPLRKNTNLIIPGHAAYDESVDSHNQFVWYPGATADQKPVGYISPAYIVEQV
ncbi:serine protease, partial [Bacillus mycoides]|nr:serine protease [Bacillus mycoides]